MTQQEKNALVAFLRTLTDDAFLSKEEFSDPFPVIVSAESFSIVDGGLQSGTLANLLESDNLVGQRHVVANTSSKRKF